ncbi:MAG: replicative DNA helicase [Clostridia bacterium]|nr:replicative DNA helicase [Clostridia bacterium]
MDNILSSKEAEESVIAAILVNRENQKYIDKIDTEDFYYTKNLRIFELMKELKQKDETIDIITIKELGVSKKYDGVGLLTAMSEMTDGLPYAGNIEKYFNILKNLSMRRKILNLSRQLCEEMEETDVNKDETDIKNEVIQKYLSIKTNDKVTNNEMVNVMVETMKDIEEKYNKRDDLRYRTGYMDLDRIIEGLHEQEFTIVAARPGVGKTAFALQMAEHIAKHGVYTYFASLEMSEKQLGNRIVAREAEIDSHVLRMGWLTDKDFEKIGKVIGEISNIPMVIDSKVGTIQEIESRANELKQEKNLGLIVIDYLQLLKSKTKFTGREQEVADISRRLKLLSKKLDIPIVALCQLNRETEKRRRPLLADLRESGSLEQDADNVIFLYVEEEEKIKNRIINVDVIVAKQRNGPTRNSKNKVQ